LRQRISLTAQHVNVARALQGRPVAIKRIRRKHVESESQRRQINLEVNILRVRSLRRLGDVCAAIHLLGSVFFC
jgi:hypothetical protein